jgi:hypothetical protein
VTSSGLIIYAENMKQAREQLKFLVLEPDNWVFDSKEKEE